MFVEWSLLTAFLLINRNPEIMECFGFFKKTKNKCRNQTKKNTS